MKVRPLPADDPPKTAVDDVDSHPHSSDVVCNATAYFTVSKKCWNAKFHVIGSEV
jgi:hypothetical protein